MVQYWLDLFTPRTWEQAQKNNFKLSGFRENRWSLVQKIKPGDILICYITKISRFSGILKVISEPYKDPEKAKKVWKEDFFPCVMNVEPLIILDFLHGVPAGEIIQKLTIAAKWGGIVRGSPNRINDLDGNTIWRILEDSRKQNHEYPLTKKVIKPTGEIKKSGKKQVYGVPIDFRGLRHAPINEMGVIYLFAIIAKDLGFRVEAIGTRFPDCEAIRRIEKTDKWERIRIEFEYKSSEFKKHGHSIEGCDLIVCWKHDWKDCPIEVLELSERIKDLGA
jgi:predicted RNA-binding protein